MLPYAVNLRRLMARNGMTLSQLVDATGLHERTIKSILNGTSKPHCRTLHRLAAGLGHGCRRQQQQYRRDDQR